MRQKVARYLNVIVLLVTIIVSAGCAGGPSPEEEATPTPVPTPIVPVKPTYRVQRGEVVKMLEFTGRIAPVVEEELFFRTAGYLGAVYKKRDDVVKAGEIIAELEVTDLKNQLAQAEASLAAAQSRNEQQIIEAKASLRAAELQLAIARADSPRARIVEARINLERAERALKDAQKAHQDALNSPWWPDEVREGTARSLREAELNLEMAQAWYQQALQASLIYSYTLELRQQEVDLARLRLEQLQAGLDVEEIRLTVERLKAQLADARLIAPFDGKLLSISLTEGRWVEAYKPVAILADPSELEVSAELTSENLQELTEGMPVTVTLSGRPDVGIPGQIRLLPYPYGGGGRSKGVGEEDTSTRITIYPKDAGTKYAVGDLVRVVVILERKDNVLWLPPQAIRTFEGRRFVVVQQDGGQARVDVKIGIEGKDRVEITEGLTEGQIVIGQ
ncbi:MAG: HlyD family efflux transporter periplasmic adaptor subunit [Anaerolineae bacterium]|nr:HlyD family efflux transporter periplasmic adaptor subunit [Anaerolineae bacterium]